MNLLFAPNARSASGWWQCQARVGHRKLDPMAGKAAMGFRTRFGFGKPRGTWSNFPHVCTSHKNSRHPPNPLCFACTQNQQVQIAEDLLHLLHLNCFLLPRLIVIYSVIYIYSLVFVERNLWGCIWPRMLYYVIFPLLERTKLTRPLWTFFQISFPELKPQLLCLFSVAHGGQKIPAQNLKALFHLWLLLT